jgi:hypothetical protein
MTETKYVSMSFVTKDFLPFPNEAAAVRTVAATTFGLTETHFNPAHKPQRLGNDWVEVEIAAEKAKEIPPLLLDAHHVAFGPTEADAAPKARAMTQPFRAKAL